MQGCHFTVDFVDFVHQFIHIYVSLNCKYPFAIGELALNTNQNV